MRGYGSPRAGRHGPKACGSPSLHAVKYRCRKTMRRPTKEWMRDSGVVVSRTYCRDGDGVVALFPPAAPFFSRRRLLGSPARNSAGASVHKIRPYSLSVLSVRPIRPSNPSAQSVCPIRLPDPSAQSVCNPCLQKNAASRCAPPSGKRTTAADMPRSFFRCRLFAYARTFFSISST